MTYNKFAFALGTALAAASLSFAPVAAAGEVTLLNVSYDVARELYKDINPAFAAAYKKSTGTDVTSSIRESRSRICHHFASESCVHSRPGPSNVLRPRLPTVNAAG